MSSKSHIGFWGLVCAAAVLVTPYFVNAQGMRTRLVAEVEQVQEVLGDSIGQRVVRTATGVYDASVGASGLREQLDKLTPTDKDKALAKEVGSGIAAAGVGVAAEYLQALSFQLYAVILRATIVLAWMLLLLPFGAAVIVDGFFARAKKFETLGFQNPTAYALGTHAAVLISAIPALYIVAPINVSPLFMPWWAVATALPLSFAIQHMQPVITR